MKALKSANIGNHELRWQLEPKHKRNGNKYK